MTLELEQLTNRVIACAITVHRTIGPGFLERIYEQAMRIELERASIKFQFQEEHPVFYRGQEIGRQRYDFLIEKCLIVELKAIRALENIHFSQTRSYLKALGLNHGLLLNFATMPLTIKRVIYSEPS